MAQTMTGHVGGDILLSDVFQLIQQGRKSGQMVLTSRTRRAEVGFTRGNITHVEVDNRNIEVVIRDWVMAMGRMSPDDLQGVESVSRSQDRSILDLMVVKKFMTAEERTQWVQMIGEDLICELFLWSEATYEFNTDVPAGNVRGVGLTISTEMIMMEGMRRTDEWPILQERLAGPGVLLTLSTPLPDDIEVSPEALAIQILGKLGEQVPLEEYERKVPFGKFRLYDALVVYANLGYVTIIQNGNTFSPLSVRENDQENSKSSSSMALIGLSVAMLLGALIFNWLASSAIGGLSSMPKSGFAGAEVRFEGQKLHTSILRYRFMTGQWPTSLYRSTDVFPLSKGERSSSTGLKYSYKANSEGYSISFSSLLSGKDKE